MSNSNIRVSRPICVIQLKAGISYTILRSMIKVLEEADLDFDEGTKHTLQKNKALNGTIRYLAHSVLQHILGTSQ